jgi:hypothetical protein
VDDTEIVPPMLESACPPGSSQIVDPEKSSHALACHRELEQAGVAIKREGGFVAALHD